MAVSVDKKNKRDSKPRKKLGKIVADILENTRPNETVSVRDVGESVFSDFDKEMQLCIDRGLAQFPGNFHIVLLIEIPKLYRGQVVRAYYIPRISCPTPGYDQTVWRYNRDSGSLNLLWTIPAREICDDIRNGVVISDMNKESMRYATAFLDGSLMKKVKELNNEQFDFPYYLKAEEKNES